MGMNESPPPMIHQLAGLLDELADHIEKGSPKMFMRQKIALAQGLVEAIAMRYPEMTRPYGVRGQMSDAELARRGL